MKRFIKRLRYKLQRFWRTEYSVFNKKWYLGSFIAAALIALVVLFSITHFGFIGFLVFWAKQGVKLAFFYLAKITMQSLLMAGIKRAFIDGIVSPTLKQHVYPHLLPAIISRIRHSGRKVGKVLAVVFAGIIAVFGVGGVFFFQGVTFLWTLGTLASTKLATILGFKTLWLFLAQAWVWIKTTSVGTFIQIYILSWVFEFLGRLIPRRFRRRLRPLWTWMTDGFWRFQSLLARLFGLKLREKSQALANLIEPEDARKKRYQNNLKEALRQKQKRKRWENPKARIRGFQAEDKKIPS